MSVGGYLMTPVLSVGTMNELCTTLGKQERSLGHSDACRTNRQFPGLHFSRHMQSGGRSKVAPHPASMPRINTTSIGRAMSLV
eukprot:5269926-Prymnesium_polylepis.1